MGDDAGVIIGWDEGAEVNWYITLFCIGQTGYWIWDNSTNNESTTEINDWWYNN